MLKAAFPGACHFMVDFIHLMFCPLHYQKFILPKFGAFDSCLQQCWPRGAVAERRVNF